MECICVIKDIYRAINAFEEEFQKTFGLCINEALVLCALREGSLASSEIAEQAGLKVSHASKLIKSVEDKGYLERAFGPSDKRYMIFSLSESGKSILHNIEEDELTIPELLQPIFRCKNLEPAFQNK